MGLSTSKGRNGKGQAVIPAEAATETSAINAPTCDVGGILELRDSPQEQCDRAAEWTALTHDCHIGTPVMLCTPHLMQTRADPAPNELISWICDECELIATSIDEHLWNIKRLGACA